VLLTNYQRLPKRLRHPPPPAPLISLRIMSGTIAPSVALTTRATIPVPRWISRGAVRLLKAAPLFATRPSSIRARWSPQLANSLGRTPDRYQDEEFARPRCCVAPLSVVRDAPGQRPRLPSETTGCLARAGSTWAPPLPAQVVPVRDRLPPFFPRTGQNTDLAGWDALPPRCAVRPPPAAHRWRG